MSSFRLCSIFRLFIFPHCHCGEEHIVKHLGCWHCRDYSNSPRIERHTRKYAKLHTSCIAVA
uniref:Secreted protein n=1 Tax=Anguilla anguilla TaxID=7936 RepID=A0A0E9WDG3_ANGAN